MYCASTKLHGLLTVAAAVNHRDMSNYISPWYCIAVSGETRDGRVIKPEWLIDADQTYDADNAEALLWFEHSRWYDPGGAVYRTKHEKAGDGSVKLFAQLQPSAALMQQAAQTEVPFRFSVELRPRSDGKMYLDGLAYTHSPASTGVDRMQFSQAKPDAQVTDFIEVQKLEFSEHRASFWNRLFSSPRTAPAPTNAAPPPVPPPTFIQTEDIMTPEQFALLQQVNQKLDAQAVDFKTIKDELAEVKTKQAEFSKLDAKLDEQFAKLNDASAKMTEINTTLMDFSTGRFKPRRPVPDGGNTTFDC